MTVVTIVERYAIMLTIRSGVCQLTFGELSEINAGIRDVRKNIREISDVLVKSSLHQEDIRQSAVVVHW